MGETSEIGSQGPSIPAAIDNTFKLSTFIPETVLTEVESSHAKAVKNDDATTETATWDNACAEDFDT